MCGDLIGCNHGVPHVAWSAQGPDTHKIAKRPMAHTHTQSSCEE